MKTYIDGVGVPWFFNAFTSTRTSRAPNRHLVKLDVEFDHADIDAFREEAVKRIDAFVAYEKEQLGAD